jgi:hypothetical protein
MSSNTTYIILHTIGPIHPFTHILCRRVTAPGCVSLGARTLSSTFSSNFGCLLVLLPRYIKYQSVYYSSDPQIADRTTTRISNSFAAFHFRLRDRFSCLFLHGGLGNDVTYTMLLTIGRTDTRFLTCCASSRLPSKLFVSLAGRSLSLYCLATLARFDCLVPFSSALYFELPIAD